MSISAGTKGDASVRRSERTGFGAKKKIKFIEKEKNMPKATLKKGLG
jgi:hypothetical protein